nr:hypothetical protein [Tanacetum cinerariifolium]
DHLGKFEGKANDGFLVGYAAHRYTCFKTNTPAGPDDTNILAEYKAHSAAAKHGFEFSIDTTALLPQANIEIRRNLVPAVADPAGGIVYIGGVPAGSDPASSVPTGEVLASSSILASSVSTGGVLVGSSIPASSVPTGGVLVICSIPASSVPAGGNLTGSSVPASDVFAGSFLARRVHAGGVLAGSLVSTDYGASSVPAASVLVPAVVSTDSAATSPLPPVHSLGSCAHTTRFPSPSDLGNHQHTAGIFSSSSYDDDFCADVTNLESNVVVDPKSKFGKSAFISYVHNQNRTNHVDHLHCLFACFLSQLEPSSVATALADPDWVAAMQEEMQQFYHQQVFAPIARIEAIRIFLEFASYMGFMVYQIDVKSAFIYGEIEEEVYVTQPKGFEDPYNPKHVYRVVKALYGLHQAPRAWCMWMTSSLAPQIKPGVISLSQDRYVKDMIKKFDMESVRTVTTPYEVPKHKSKDEPDDAVNVHLFRSMIGSLMYLTASRPDIMFAVSACSRYQVSPLTSHLNAVKKIFKYLKGQPDFGLWYPQDSSFQLEAYSDSDYAGSHGDRKSTTGGCQFLGRRLISWLCKKQTVVATSSTEAEYVAAASCCGQALWIQNQMLDYGFNFMHTRIFIDNQSTICIVKNPVFYQCTKHIKIRHHFIRDAYEKNLIQVVKIHTDENVADLLTKSFDGPRFHYLIVHIGMLNPLVCADDLVSAGGCTLPASSYSFLLLDLFLLVVLLISTVGLVPPGSGTTSAAGPHMPLLAPMLVVPASGDAAGAAANVATGLGPSSAPQVPPEREHSPVREHSLVRDPTPIKEPTPRPEPKPTPDSPSPHSPPPSLAGVGPTTSSRPPSPSRPPSGLADIREGGGAFASSHPSNEALQTPAAMAAGGAEDSVALTALTLKLDECLHRVTTLENKLGITKKVLGDAILKLVTRVKRLEGLLQQRKRRLVLSDSEGEDATTTEQEFDLAALHTLASATLGDDPSATAAGPDVETTMPVERTSTTRKRIRKPFTSSISAHVSETIPPSVRVPAAATTIPAASSVDAAIRAAAPSPSIPTAADKGNAPMVDDSPPADLLSEQERVLKNLHDSQLGEELAKKIQAEQEAEFARQQEELAQKAQAESDDVTKENMNERLGMLLMRKRRELAEQSQVKPMTKTQQRDYMRDFVMNCSASVYNQGWTMKKVKTLSIAQLRLEFEYIQRHLERSNFLNFRRSTFRPKPTLDAPPAKRANQEAPPVPAVSTQDPASVPAAPSIPVDASLPAASLSDPVAIPVPAVSIAHAAVFIFVEPMVHPVKSHMDDPLTAPAHGSSESTVAAPSSSSSRHRCKHIAKKRVTPIVDVADAAMIKFDSDSNSDDDPLPYVPYAGWEMGDLHVLFQSLDDTDALHFWRTQDSWRIRSWRLYPRAQVHVLEMVDGRVTKNWMVFTFHVPFWNDKWLVQEGTALGKDKSNPLTVGSLLKTTWSSIHHLLTNEVLTSPEQTATGKDISNPLMAVMVCQKPSGYFSSPMIHVPRAKLVFNPPGYVVPAGSEHSHSCCCVLAGKHSFCLYINTSNWDLPIVCYDDDDEDYVIAVTPSLSTEEPDNSLSIEDEHLDTVSATESDEFIKSSVESLVSIPSESEGIPDKMCDVPFHDNSLPLDYVEASHPDFELVSSEEMEIVISEVGGIDDDILLTIKDDILREKLLNVNLLIANIEALNDNPAPSFDLMTNGSTNTHSNISLPEYEALYDDHVKEISSGSTTTHSDSSLYDSFIFDLSINPFPHADRSDFYEFADELTHIISLPE